VAELHPGKAIIEGDNGSFDLDAFVRAEKCSLVHETALFNHIKTDWMGPGRAPRPSVENSWVNILWQGKLLDVIFITYTQGCYPSRHYWIVADDKQVAGEFFAAVCDWSSEVRGEVLIFQDGEWVKSRRLYDAIKSATFDNLILRDGLKQEIQNDFAQFFQSRDVYERYRILEDLDSMIDDKSRAFFLNELDGFESNTGVVVVATTNYPERLDPAILNRPSRFDRKYYFDLPGPSERAAYLALWNQELQAELRLSAKVAGEVVLATAGFSFAYLKELFLSSMMQWISIGRGMSMDKIILHQTAMLRSQISDGQAKSPDHNHNLAPEMKTGEDRGRAGKITYGMPNFGANEICVPK